ncbi:MAG: phosphoribosylanthranilate isomerase [Candidatus Promineifilaceae bacterium]
MTKIKICGITNLDDAIVAAEAGADFLGFILYPPSKRVCDVKAAQCIVSHLRSLDTCPTLVGVFVNEPLAFVRDTMNVCGFDMVQLHGEESADYLHSFGEQAYKAIRPRTTEEAEAKSATYSVTSIAARPTLLIDAYHPDLYGGTGETSDWEMARRIQTDSPQLMLAGGLTCANVVQAIREVQPWAVDVASGVEASPGIKNHDAVRAFIRHVRQADQL